VVFGVKENASQALRLNVVPTEQALTDRAECQERLLLTQGRHRLCPFLFPGLKRYDAAS
jgi:hypothetical protein